MMLTPTQKQGAWRRLLGTAAAAAVISTMSWAGAGPALAQAADADAAATLETYDADTPLATVGGEVVTLGDLIAARQLLPPQAQALDPAQLFDELLSRIVQERLLGQAAAAQGLQDDPQVRELSAATRKALLMDRLMAKVDADPATLDAVAAAAGLDGDAAIARQLDALERSVLAQAYIEKTISEKLTDEAVQALYDERFSEPQVEVRARHILVETEEEAQAIVAELEGGADFVELAQQKSTGPSGQNGGDLGFFRRGQMVPAFEEAAFALSAPGDLSAPVQSSFGWHVIKLEERRESPPPDFASVEGQIRQALQFRLTQEERARLEAEGGFERAETMPPVSALTEDGLLTAQ